MSAANFTSSFAAVKLPGKFAFCLSRSNKSACLYKVYGFSLLELLLVIALMAILSAVAWPQYQQYITRSKRQQAERCLLVMSSSAEQLAQMQNDYSSITSQSLLATCVNDSVLANTYKFIWQGQGAHYLLKAIPQKQQATHDQACAILQLDDRGRRAVSGTMPVRDCWR
jgi:type IV pilus assembly protein PilE